MSSVGVVRILALAGALTLSGGAATAAVSPAGSGVLAMQMSGGQTVQVVDTAGKPVSGVRVFVQELPEAPRPDLIEETTMTATNAQGTFTAPSRQGGGALVVLRKPGYASPAFDASKALPSKIVLEPGVTLKGEVMTRDGVPIPGAWVGPIRLKNEYVEHQPSVYRPLSRQVVAADDQGGFHVDSLSSAPVEVQIAADGFMPKLFEGLPGSELKVSLSTDGTEVSGTVVGSHDRMPQPNVWVQATGGGLSLAERTDNDGIFTFQHMPAGVWVFRPAGGGPVSGTQSRAETVDVAPSGPGTSVSLVLNQGIRLSGRVIDAETSAPMVGVGLLLTGYGNASTKSAVSGAGGVFSFDDLDASADFTIRFDALHYVYVLPGGATRDYFQLPRRDDLDLTSLTIPLRKRAGVLGHVTDESGAPADNVEVTVEARDFMATSPAKMGKRPLRFSGFTNPSGDYVIGVYPGGRYKVWGNRGTGEITDPKFISTFTTAPAARADLHLARGRSLGGIVLGDDDKPVTAAVVIAYPEGSPEPTGEVYPGNERYKYTMTGMEGVFGFNNLSGEKLVLRATDPDFVQPAYLTVDPTSPDVATTDQVKLKFPAGGNLSATVTDDKGNPVSQATVRADYMIGLNGKSASTVTDAYGHARIRSLPVKQLKSVSVTHPVFAEYRLDGPVSLPANDLAVKLLRRPSITVNVTEGGAAPTANGPLEVMLLQAPSSSDKPGGNPPDSNLYQEFSRSTVVGGRAAFPNVGNGWYKAALGGSGRFAESDPVFASTSTGDQTIKLDLPANARLTGRVYDKDSGKGLPGTVVTIGPAAETARLLSGVMQTVTAKDNGEFEVDGIGRGSLVVKASAQGYPDYEKTIQNDGSKLDIALSNAPGALQGKVSSGGSPVSGAMLLLTKTGAEGTPLATSMTDSAGHYHLTGFPVGTYSLMCEAPVGAGDNISHKTVEVQVDDETAKKDIDFPPLVTVSGRVTVGGKPAAHDDGSTVTVLFMPQFKGGEPRTAGLDEDGMYSVQLEAGKYSVGLEDQAGRPVEIPSGASYELNLAF